MKAILVIETDAKHIEDLYIETIWNDFVLIDLGKEYHFKPMPAMVEQGYPCDEYEIGKADGYNKCILEILGETE